MKFKSPNEKPKTEWEIKFFRESPFMPFGSMMNAYGQNFTSKGIDIKDFLSDSKKIFKLAKALVKDAYDFSQDIYEPEPISMEQAQKASENFQKIYDKEAQLRDIAVETGEVPPEVVNELTEQK